MGLQINTNELALSAQRHLSDSSRALHGTIQRLASGSRIVQASDDPAGLAISDSLNSQIRSLGQAVRNAQDGVSLIQVYEGGTNEINNMGMRIRELAMQSASDTVGDRERSMLNNEVIQLKQEIDRVAHTTKYCGRELLSGEAIKMDFQVGINNNPEVDRISFNPGDTNMTLSALGLDGIDISKKEDAQESLETLDNALNKVNDIRARVGSAQNRLTTTINATGIFQENLMAAKSRIRDADIAVESSNYARETIIRKAGVAVLAQANETPALALQLLR
jgi:flagellin